MHECNDIRWALERIEKRQVRMESRQLGQREQNLIALLKIAVNSDIVKTALGEKWVKQVAQNIAID